MYMYVVVKNGKTVLSHGINKNTWKYLDECKEFAIAALEDPADTIEICELAPVYTYNLDLVCKETEIKPPCNCPTIPDVPDTPTEPGGTPNPNPDETIGGAE